MNDSSCAFLGLNGWMAMSIIRWITGVARSPEGSASAEGQLFAKASQGLQAESDYSRGGPAVSSPALGLRADRVSLRWNLLAGLAILCVMGVFAPGLSAQYVGRVAKTDKDQPVLRSVAVLEWVGDAGKPSASRLVPVTVYDGEQLNDGTIYLSRPEPMALA